MNAQGKDGAAGGAGFSLIELVIVVVIIGVIGAIAIPRLSRGTQGATQSAAIHNEQALQRAVERYTAEHEGLAPSTAQIAEQLTGYTDIHGNVSDSKTPPYIYGPYLRTIPVQVLGQRTGESGIATADDAEVGWIYETDAASLRANVGSVEEK